MKTKLVDVNDHGVSYQALMFVCPGCAGQGPNKSEGVHMLPVNSPHIKKPSWEWDGNLELPTLTPSILTRGGVNGSNTICHSFLKNGVFVFLTDCTHSMVGQNVPIPDLPDWATRMESDD